MNTNNYSSKYDSVRHHSPRRYYSPRRYNSPRRYYRPEPILQTPLDLTSGLLYGTAATLGLARPYPYNPYYGYYGYY